MISYREEFVKRANVHQTHLEDLVLLGPDGLDEIKDKINKFFDKVDKNKDSGLSLTSKIDGSPALICYSKFTGYPDNSICLKSFVNNANNVISSEDEIEAKYGDRPSMAEKLVYGLQLAKLIPEGEAWQGDCLFTEEDKQVENIRGKEYITFQPNKIVYAFSEDNPGYEDVKNAEFGIAFHTVYKDDGNGGKSQSFRPAIDQVLWPDWAYIMSPALNVNKDNFNLDNIKSEAATFNELADRLTRDPAYKDLVNNEIFMQYWNTFENANIADKKQAQLNSNTVINDLKDYVSEKQTIEFQKKFSSLKTSKGKMSAIDKWAGAVAELKDIIDYNEETIILLVETLNAAVAIKMSMWSGFKNSSQDYSTFFKSRSKGIIDANMEGVAMSDADGNIVKIVDRTEFSSANRDPDILAGWEHPENSLKEATFTKQDATKEADAYMTAVLDDIQNSDFILTGKDGTGREVDLNDLRANIDDLSNKIEAISALGCTAEAVDIFNSTFKDYVKWSDIYKGKYSGYDEKKMKTDEQESIQGIFLALNILGRGQEIANDDARIYDVKSDIYNGAACGIHLKNTTINLRDYKTQMEKMRKVLTMDLPEELIGLDNFTIVQPDGLKSGMDEKIIKKLFATGFSFKSDNGFTLDKDTFAPADLYIINKTPELLEELYEKLNALPKEIYPSDYVAMTNTLFNDRVAIPISLKMSSNPKFYKIINSDSSALDYFSLDDITKINFNQSGNSTMELDYNDDEKRITAVLEFRTKGSAATSWQCNANIKGNTDAYAGGSVKTYMKIAFSSDMSETITQEDLAKIMVEFGDKITGTPECALGTNAKSKSSQLGNIGLGVFCKELINHKENVSTIVAGKRQEYDKAFTYVIQHSFKKADDIQNSLKIM
jgi:hypothetical protein